MKRIRRQNKMMDLLFDKVDHGEEAVRAMIERKIPMDMQTYVETMTAAGMLSYAGKSDEQLEELMEQASEQHWMEEHFGQIDYNALMLTGDEVEDGRRVWEAFSYGAIASTMPPRSGGEALYVIERMIEQTKTQPEYYLPHVSASYALASVLDMKDHEWAFYTNGLIPLIKAIMQVAQPSYTKKETSWD